MSRVGGIYMLKPVTHLKNMKNSMLNQHGPKEGDVISQPTGGKNTPHTEKVDAENNGFYQTKL
jgi:hypothetical protein